MVGAGEGGVATNQRVAFDWFRLAAFRGDPVAQRRLAVLYRGGRVVTREITKAYAWFLIAAEAGDARAAEAVRDLRHELTAKEHARAKQRVAAIKKRMATIE